MMSEGGIGRPRQRGTDTLFGLAAHDYFHPYRGDGT
jgi:hypothetical protein